MIKFNSNNNRDLLAKIHKLNNLEAKLNEIDDQDIMMEYVIETQQRKDFHLVSSINETRCKTLVCRICGDDKFFCWSKRILYSPKMY